MAATSASAAPGAETTGRPEAGASTISDAALRALATAPAVVVDADATWSVDDISDGVAVNAATEEAAGETTPETSRDTERTAIQADVPVQSLSERGHATSALNVRSGPGTGYARIGSVSGYNTFDITGKADGWYRISYNGGEGWVSGSYTTLGSAPAAPAASTTSASASAAPASSSGFGASVVAIARQYLGTPYVYGGKTPAGFDCSGFTSYVFAQMGVSIPSSSAGQYGVGTPVSAANAQPGDLMVWSGHTAIYTGNGMHIAARNPGTPLAETPIYRSGASYFRLG